MTRVAKKLLKEVPTRDEAVELLAAYTQADARERQINAKIDEQTSKIREKYQTELQAASETKKETFDRLQLFAESNEDLFADKKSMELTHGTIGFRTGTPALKAASGFQWLGILQLVKANLPNYIRVEESIDKAAILADRRELLQKGLLSKVGIKLVQAETFFVATKTEEV